MSDDIDQGGPSAEYTAAAERRAEDVQMNKSLDTELAAVYERMNGRAAQEKDFLAKPEMPPAPAGLSDQEAGRLEFNWLQMPLKDRQAAALAARELKALKEVGESLNSPQWKEIPGETVTKTLARAQKMLARSRSQRAPHKGSNVGLDNTLKAMARKAYGEG